MSTLAFPNQPRGSAKFYSPPGNCLEGLPRCVWLTTWLGALVLLTTRPAMAQEALRTSLTGDAAAEARRRQYRSLPYTFKYGDFKLLIVPSLRLDWNDNVNISRTNAQQALILSPQLQLNASYPVTRDNLLSLNFGGGYQQYFEHDTYSTWFIRSGTELSFDIYVKDFWFNLHDWVHYYQDTSQQPELSGTATYATVNNTAGLSVTWDLNEATLSTGYDHENVFSTTRRYNSQNSASEMVFARAGLKVYPGVVTGVEGTAAYTTYDEEVLNNNHAYSAGAYADWEMGKSFRLRPRGGYTVIQFQHTSETIQTSDLNSWYADLTIIHQVTDAIHYTFGAGHEVRTGIESDVIEDWYVRPAVRWNIIKDLALRTSISYQYGEQGVGNEAGNLTEHFNWLGSEVSISYPILKKLSLSLNYRITLRSSDIATDEYTQNVVGLTLTYRPQ
jgi:hypothetical protein